MVSHQEIVLKQAAGCTMKMLKLTKRTQSTGIAINWKCNQLRLNNSLQKYKKSLASYYYTV